MRSDSTSMTKSKFTLEDQNVGFPLANSVNVEKKLTKFLQKRDRAKDLKAMRDTMNVKDRSHLRLLKD